MEPRATQSAVIRDATSSDDEEVCAIMTEYMTWALARLHEKYGVIMNADAGHTAASLAPFRPPHGSVIIADVNGRPVAVGAVKVAGDKVAEIKRMYVRPEFRGQHIGSRLLDRLLDVAQVRFGAEIVRLDSNLFMEEAHRLYETRGFVTRPAYDGSEIPPEFRHLWKFYERPAELPD